MISRALLQFRRLQLLLLIALAALTPAVLAQPTGGRVVARVDDGGAFEVDANKISSEIVSVAGPGFGKAIRAMVQKRGNSWDVEARVKVDGSFAQDQKVAVHFWARAIQTRDESGQGLLVVSLGETSPPWKAQFARTFSVGDAWQEFSLRGTVAKDYQPGQLALKLSFGLVPQIMEVGGVSVVSYGAEVDVKTLPETRATYAGREWDAPWRAAARARIEALRMAPFSVQVIDRSGKLVPGASVRVALQKHAFEFGSAVNPSTLLSDDKPGNAAYRARLLELFNAASFYNSLKWEAWSGEWGDTLNQSTTLRGLEWLRAHDLPIRGHVLVWPSFHNMPSFMKKLEDKSAEKAGQGALSTASSAELQRLVLSRIDEVTQATAPYITEWDVINEPRDNHDMMDISGRQVMVDYFERAHNRLPNARLVLNDYAILSVLTDGTTQQIYEDNARYLIAQGAPLSGLGFQGHFGANVPSPLYVQRVLDRFGALGLPIRITEFTIGGDDDTLKADWTRDFLTMIFSHPSISGFQMWGLEEAVNPDGTLTAIGQAYRRLVKENWNTDLTGQTDADGRVAARGFLGHYAVTVTQGARTLTVPFDLRQNSLPLMVTLP